MKDSKHTKGTITPKDPNPMTQQGSMDKDDRKDLTKKENWTKDLIYVHRTRLIIGFILGVIIGVLL